MAITPRLLFLKNKWDARLSERQAKDRSHPRDADPMHFLIEIDPTLKREYTDWLCRTYVSGNFLYEDRERVKITLELYNRYKHRLPVEQRDIGRMKTEQDVWSIVEAFLPKDDAAEEPTPSGRERKRQERAKAIAESDVVDDDLSEGWTIASPKTHFSSQWWGKGTRWCTAMRTSENYDSYMSTGRLRVFITPEGEKLQAHITSMTICDANDTPLNFEEEAKRLPKAAIDLLRQDLIQAIDNKELHQGELIETPESIPSVLFDEKTTNEIRRKIVSIASKTIADSDDGWSLTIQESDYAKWLIHLNVASEDILKLKKRSGTDRMKIISLMKEGDIQQIVSLGHHLGEETSKLETRGLIDKIIATDDKDFITSCAEMLMKTWSDSVNRSSVSIQFIDKFPDDCKSDKFWMYYAKGFGEFTRGNKFPTPPEKYIVGERVLDIGRYNLQRLPVSKITSDIINECMQSSGAEGLQFVKDNDLFKLMTEDEIIAFACSFKGDDVEYLPAKYLTPKLVDEYVNQRPAHIGKLDKASDFKMTGESVLTDEHCRLAVEKSGAALASIPIRFITDDLIDHAITHHPSSINHLPKPLHTAELYVKCIEIDPDTISYVSSDKFRIPYETFLSSISRSPRHIGIVPLPYRTIELCQAAMEHVMAKHKGKGFNVPPVELAMMKANIEDIAKHVPPRVAQHIPEIMSLKAEKPHQTNWLAKGYMYDPYIHDFDPLNDDPFPDALPRLFKTQHKEDYTSMPAIIVEIMEDLKDDLIEDMAEEISFKM